MTAPSRGPLTGIEIPLLRSVEGHHRPVPFFLTREMFGGLPFELAGGEITDLVDAPVAEPHTHDVDEIYLLVAPASGAATIDVFVEEEHRRMEAPEAMLVPAGARHHFVTRRASPGSFCFGILLTDRAAAGE